MTEIRSSIFIVRETARFHDCQLLSKFISFIFFFFFFFFIFLHLIIKEDAWSLKGHVWRVFNDVSFTLGRIIRNVLADWVPETASGNFIGRRMTPPTTGLLRKFSFLLSSWWLLACRESVAKLGLRVQPAHHAHVAEWSQGKSKPRVNQ